MFKLEGAYDRYLFVEPGTLNWCIYPSLEAPRDYIQSGSCGQPCPAHPRNKISHNEDNHKDWSFGKSGEDSEPDWEEGGIKVQCSLHDHQAEVSRSYKIKTMFVPTGTRLNFREGAAAGKPVLHHLLQAANHKP